MSGLKVIRVLTVAVSGKEIIAFVDCNYLKEIPIQLSLFANRMKLHWNGALQMNVCSRASFIISDYNEFVLQHRIEGQ